MVWNFGRKLRTEGIVDWNGEVSEQKPVERTGVIHKEALLVSTFERKKPAKKLNVYPCACRMLFLCSCFRVFFFCIISTILLWPFGIGPKCTRGYRAQAHGLIEADRVILVPIWCYKRKPIPNCSVPYGRDPRRWGYVWGKWGQWQQRRSHNSILYSVRLFWKRHMLTDDATRTSPMVKKFVHHTGEERYFSLQAYSRKEGKRQDRNGWSKIHTIVSSRRMTIVRNVSLFGTFIVFGAMLLLCWHADPLVR